jgi:hypothetical protein
MTTYNSANGAYPKQDLLRIYYTQIVQENTEPPWELTWFASPILRHIFAYENNNPAVVSGAHTQRYVDSRLLTSPYDYIKTTSDMHMRIG